MDYVNTCPECKSKDVQELREIRFRKTMFGFLVGSLLPIAGCFYDSMRLSGSNASTLQQNDQALYLAAKAGLEREIGYMMFLTVGLWVAAAILAFIKKITRQCKSCSLVWRP